MLQNLNTLLVHVHGGLYRLVKADAIEGFTDKEKEFILKRKNVIEQAQRDLTALGNHMRTKYNQDA